LHAVRMPHVVSFSEHERDGETEREEGKMRGKDSRRSRMQDPQG